jgi:hypothetical protein
MFLWDHVESAVMTVGEAIDEVREAYAINATDSVIAEAIINLIVPVFGISILVGAIVAFA